MPGQTGGLRAPGGGGWVRTAFPGSPARSPQSPFPSVHRNWTRVNLPVLGAGWDAVRRLLFPAALLLLPWPLSLCFTFNHLPAFPGNQLQLSPLLFLPLLPSILILLILVPSLIFVNWSHLESNNSVWEGLLNWDSSPCHWRGPFP